MINVTKIKQTLASISRPRRGVMITILILDRVPLKLFLFKFFHEVDLHKNLTSGSLGVREEFYHSRASGDNGEVMDPIGRLYM